jgi:thiamine biosynthesis lipoprotein ApbE
MGSAAPVPLVYRTRGLGTSAEVAVTDGRKLVEAAALLHDELDTIDRLASRFRDDSEISALHHRRGRRAVVSPELFEILSAALAVAKATDGAVDPTVGGAMCRLGYDRDFAALGRGDPGELPEPAAVPGWECVELDAERSSVFVPEEVRLDLGTVAKAWAADRAAEKAAGRLGCGVLVSLGGDVAVSGPVCDGGFAVAVTDRCDAEPADKGETVAMSSGGLATSGTTKRRWLRGERMVHHIVDPATGLPAVTVWRTASVIASSCLGANAAATAAVVKGAGAAEWLAGLGLPARLVAHDGDVTVTADWPRQRSSMLTERTR